MLRQVLSIVACAALITALAVASALSVAGPAPPDGLLFNGERESAWSFEHAADPRRITEVSDPAGSDGTALRITARDEDVAPPTSLGFPLSILTGSGGLMEPGGEYWQSFELYLPSAEFPVPVPPDAWVTLQAPVSGPPFRGNPPISLGVSGTDLQWEANAYAPDPFSVVWRTPIVLDRWIRFTWHFRLADRGWVELFVDGTPAPLRRPDGARTFRLRLATIDRSVDQGPWDPRLSVGYARGMAAEVTAYFRGFRLGTRRSAVVAPPHRNG